MGFHIQRLRTLVALHPGRFDSNERAIVDAILELDHDIDHMRKRLKKAQEKTEHPESRATG